MQSIIPLEDKALAVLRRITLAQLESVLSALENGGIGGWKKLGFEAQRDKALREFVEAVWRQGEANADRVILWARNRRGKKPVGGDVSEGIVAKDAGNTLGRERWEPEYLPSRPLGRSKEDIDNSCRRIRIALLGGDEAAKEVWAELQASPFVGLANVPPAEGLAWYQNYVLHLAGVAEQELLDKTKKTIANAANLGLTTKETRDELQGLFKSFPNYRLTNLLRTESAHIYNTSSLSRYQGAQGPDGITGYRYFVTQDDRTSDICQGYVDKVVPANELRDSPPFHFQCRTTLEPLFYFESFTPSDMSGIEPMAGFGTPFPMGTGLMAPKPPKFPGITGAPLKVPAMPKVPKVPNLREFGGSEEAQHSWEVLHAGKAAKNAVEVRKDFELTKAQKKWIDPFKQKTSGRLTHNTSVGNAMSILRTGRIETGIGPVKYGGETREKANIALGYSRKEVVVCFNYATPKEEGLLHYGAVCFDLKHEVAERARFVAHQSFQDGRAFLLKDADDIAGLVFTKDMWSSKVTLDDMIEMSGYAPTVEGQVAGTIARDEIKSITVMRDYIEREPASYRELFGMAREYNIPMRVIELSGKVTVDAG